MTEHDSWGAAARARVSDRWVGAAFGWNKAMTDALLAAAALTPDSVVLDLAAGSGDPALTVAERVIKTRARQVAFDSKVSCIQADAHAIPLARDSVDRITCRCGIMFFDNTGLVMSEMLRVLKPGGRVALLAWGSFEQPFFDATVSVALRLLRDAQMPPEARTMFRFASPGSLERELKAAGFSSVHERSLTVPRICAGTPHELWTYQQEVSTLCHPLFNSIPTDLRAKVDAEVSSWLARFQSGSVLSVPVNVIVAGGQRPE